MQRVSFDRVDFFLGATTPAGFKGYFEPLRHEPGMQLYLIKSGPGCGKSTLLRCLAGLEAPDAGSIFVNGEDITHTKPQKRGIGMVFQSYALFPNMTAAENIATR